MRLLAFVFGLSLAGFAVAGWEAWRIWVDIRNANETA
jgi:hypothetical protein